LRNLRVRGVFPEECPLRKTNDCSRTAVIFETHAAGFGTKMVSLTTKFPLVD
jgi:hypothetical protein